MTSTLSITPLGERGYDLAWSPQGDAVLRWDDDGWVMETWRDGAVIDLVNVSLKLYSSELNGIDWNAVVRRVEELTK